MVVIMVRVYINRIWGNTTFSLTMRGISLFFLAFPLLVFAATADQWRSRSIYQLIVDRYALPQGADLNACDPGAQTWCGGTWNTCVLLYLFP